MFVTASVMSLFLSCRSVISLFREISCLTLALLSIVNRLSAAEMSSTIEKLKCASTGLKATSQQPWNHLLVEEKDEMVVGSLFDQLIKCMYRDIQATKKMRVAIVRKSICVPKRRKVKFDHAEIPYWISGLTGIRWRTLLQNFYHVFNPGQALTIVNDHNTAVVIGCGRTVPYYMAQYYDRTSPCRIRWNTIIYGY